MQRARWQYRGPGEAAVGGTGQVTFFVFRQPVGSITKSPI